MDPLSRLSAYYDSQPMGDPGRNEAQLRDSLVAEEYEPGLRDAWLACVRFGQSCRVRRLMFQQSESK